MFLPWSCHGLAMILPYLGMSLPCSCHASALAMARMWPSCLDASVSTQIQHRPETHLGVPDFIWTICDNWGTPRMPHREPSPNLETKCLT
jgi:hypothetical protein